MPCACVFNNLSFYNLFNNLSFPAASYKPVSLISPHTPHNPLHTAGARFKLYKGAPCGSCALASAAVAAGDQKAGYECMPGTTRMTLMTVSLVAWKIGVPEGCSMIQIVYATLTSFRKTWETVRSQGKHVLKAY